ncbi:MAG: PadR family transcriptional regulator [Clostridia bacterium]
MTFTITAKLLDACVLGVVDLGDTYGYDLTQKVGSLIDISESALYPVLRRLSKEGLLTTYDVPFDGRNRKYYQITSEGKNRLLFYKEEWENYKNTVDKVLGGNVNG